jgi:hypothetical protein
MSFLLAVAACILLSLILFVIAALPLMLVGVQLPSFRVGARLVGWGGAAILVWMFGMRFV